MFNRKEKAAYLARFDENPKAQRERAAYKFALCRRLNHEAMNEARAIENAAERAAWLRIGREARADARRWLQELRRANGLQLCA